MATSLQRTSKSDPENPSVYFAIYLKSYGVSYLSSPLSLFLSKYSRPSSSGRGM